MCSRPDRPGLWHHWKRQTESVTAENPRSFPSTPRGCTGLKACDSAGGRQKEDKLAQNLARGKCRAGSTRWAAPLPPANWTMGSLLHTLGMR